MYLQTAICKHLKILFDTVLVRIFITFYAINTLVFGVIFYALTAFWIVHHINSLPCKLMCTITQKLNFTIPYEAVAYTAFEMSRFFLMSGVIIAPTFAGVFCHVMTALYQDRRADGWFLFVTIPSPTVFTMHINAVVFFTARTVKWYCSVCMGKYLFQFTAPFWNNKGSTLLWVLPLCQLVFLFLFYEFPHFHWYPGRYFHTLSPGYQAELLEDLFIDGDVLPP